MFGYCIPFLYLCTVHPRTHLDNLLKQLMIKLKSEGADIG